MPQNPSGAASRDIVADALRLLRQPCAAPEISALPVAATMPEKDRSRPCALLLSPHPDDECLTGALPLRLRHEENWRIINVAVTLGSNQDRWSERKNELAKACAVLGFTCVLSEENGFSEINANARGADAAAWNEKVERIGAIIDSLRPQAVFMPHAEDWHATHIGTHFLGMDALAGMPKDFTCGVALTEYWQPMAEPNAMIGVGECDAATLMDALACHAGEMSRNGYDRRFPAYLIDAVRRGERVSGKGKNAPDMDFAQIYRLGSWIRGKFTPSTPNRVVGDEASLGSLFE